MVYRNKRKKIKRGKRIKYDRINFLAVIVFIFAFFLILQLFNIQVLQHPFYDALAKGQHSLYEKLLPERGSIFAKNYLKDGEIFPLATNKKVNFIYAVPEKIKSPQKAAEKLGQLLDLEEEVILERLSKKEDLFEPIKHFVSDEKWEEVKSLEIEGIEAREETQRYYPENETASHVLGYVGQREDSDQPVGQYGIEGYFNQELAGQQGYLDTEKDAGGRWITVGGMDIKEAVDGDDLVLTIDQTVQYTACQKLEKWVKKHKADSGTMIIMEPQTGKILAMCGYPDFDPNNYNQVENIEVYKNPAIYNTYEPGSVFKAFTMASALDLGKVTPETTYTDTGEEKIGPYTIKNSDLKAHGEQTMTQVLEESLNTGAIYAMRQVGEKLFYQYVKDFGFGEKTGLKMDTELGGSINNLKKYKEIYAATASFGQGITVTPLQIVNAFSAIANKGKLMKPYIVDEIRKPDGSIIKSQPEEIRQVIDPKTATTLSAMLVNVVEKGHGKRAGVDGYFVAGKTGTSQVPKKNGVGYEEHHTIGSFAGFAPASDPKFAMLVKVDRPRTVEWAASTAAPLFGEMSKFLLNYFSIPPSRDIE
ncbi:MAG: penicillin-binding protein 2 [Patescibacteria group bacterium]|nr:penicillin-binding protein 2 [Patescibacteria group bacterium]